MEKYFTVFLILFIFLFLIHYFLVTMPALRKIYKPKKGKNKKTSIKELDYLVYKFKIYKNKINYKSFGFMVSLINSFIMALVVVVVEVIPFYFIFRIIIAFILLTGLIYSLYEIYGRYLKKKEERIDE